MTNAWKRHAIELAICLAVMMHLLLFMSVRSVSNMGFVGVLVPPETHYLVKPSGSSLATGYPARKVWSPVLFSLPSEMGFSRGLFEQDVRTALRFSKSPRYESFLEINAVPQEPGAEIDSTALMVSLVGRTVPHPPVDIFQVEEERPTARRVYLDPKLKERLLGGIVLPPELNQAVDTAWQVHAAVSIAPQGSVQHVFFDQPLESEAMNQEVLQMLFGLRFKPDARSAEGRIEIYSPEAEGAE